MCYAAKAPLCFKHHAKFKLCNFIIRLNMIVRVNVVLNRTVVDRDRGFNNLSVFIFRVKVGVDRVSLWY